MAKTDLRINLPVINLLRNSANHQFSTRNSDLGNFPHDVGESATRGALGASGAQLKLALLQPRQPLLVLLVQRAEPRPVVAAHEEGQERDR